jgi:hypothetical protein
MNAINTTNQESEGKASKSDLTDLHSFTGHGRYLFASVRTPGRSTISSL